MKFPQELNAVLGQFHTESFIGRTESQAIRSALHAVGQVQRLDIYRFLSVKLAGRYDAEELLRLIWESPADVAPVDADNAVKFLELIRDSIDAEGHIVSPA